MKKIFLIILIIVLVILFGTYPLSIFSKIFEYLSNIFKWLANSITLFGWKGFI